MTGVIKSRDALTAKVRLFSAPHQPPVLSLVEQAFDDERAALGRDVQDLRLELEQRTLEIERLRAERDQAFAAGEAQGRQLGLGERDTLRADTLARLKVGIERAVETYGREMISLERLALLVAYEGLEKLLNDPADRKALLGEIIAKQIRALDAQAGLDIEVSRSDFPQPDDLADLAAALSRPGVNLLSRGDLQSGDCRIRLALGALEIGLHQQWGRLGAMLQDAALPEAAK